MPAATASMLRQARHEGVARDRVPNLPKDGARREA
jgi:hypothetical protein